MLGNPEDQFGPVPRRFLGERGAASFGERTLLMETLNLQAFARQPNKLQEVMTTSIKEKTNKAAQISDQYETA